MIQHFPQELISKYTASGKGSGILRNTFMWDGTNVWFNVSDFSSNKVKRIMLISTSLLPANDIINNIYYLRAYLIHLCVYMSW